MRLGNSLDATGFLFFGESAGLHMRGIMLFTVGFLFGDGFGDKGVVDHALLIGHFRLGGLRAGARLFAQ